jgi:nicotinamide mononucleotide (NMN) deamidase PncC
LRAEGVRRGLVARDPAEIDAALGLDGALIAGEMSRETAEQVAQAMRGETGASHALVVLIEVDDGPDRIDFGGSIHLAIAAEEGVESRRSRIYAGRDWVRLGAVELGSTAFAAICRASRSLSAPISNGFRIGPRRARFAHNIAILLPSGPSA